MRFEDSTLVYNVSATWCWNNIFSASIFYYAILPVMQSDWYTYISNIDLIYT